MRVPSAAVVLVALLLSLPAGLAGQIGVGVRVGTLGIAGDVAVALSDRAQVRGGVGLMPFEPSGTFSDIDFTVELPSSFTILGLDYFPTGGFRIGAGILLKPDDPEIRGEFSGSVEIGGETYSGAEVGTLTGKVESRSVAPYLMIGYGKHASSGIGFYADLGAAFIGDPRLTLEAGGPIADDPDFRADLEEERRDIQEDLDRFRIYPILNVGVRVGIGN